MKNAKDYKTNQSKGILILGAPGSGKTTLAAQIAGNYILDCDNNLSGAVRLLGDRAAFTYDIVNEDDAGKEVEPQGRFKHLTTLIAEASTQPSVRAITIDSLSTFSQYIFDDILRQQARTQMQLQDWGTFQQVLARTFTRMRTTSRAFVLTGHVETEKDEISGMVRYYPLLSGKMQKLIGLYFSDVWFCEVVERNQKHEWMVRTLPNTWNPGLKNSFGFPALVSQADVVAALTKL